MIHLRQIAATTGIENQATLDRPLDHLLACHRRIEERLDVLRRAAGHLGDRRAEALEAIANSFRFLDSNGALHTADEEESLFPRLCGRVGGQDADFLRALEEDHREVERVYRGVKDVYAAMATAADRDIGQLDKSFGRSVDRLRELYRAHIAAEDARLIGLGREVLDATELSAISLEMKTRRHLSQ